MGFWKLGHHLEVSSARPTVIFIQEAAGNGRSFQVFSQFWDKLGYKAFNGLSDEFVYRDGCKGVITLVADKASSKQVSFYGGNKAAILAVCTDELLLLNCYGAPDNDGSIQRFVAQAIEQILQSIRWTKGIVIGGDFNVELADSFFEALAGLHDLLHWPPSTLYLQGGKVARSLITFFVPEDWWGNASLWRRSSLIIRFFI